MKNTDTLDVAIISLKEHSVRRDKIAKELESQGYNSKISYAINGKNMNAHEYFCASRCETSKRKGRKYLTPSELGCFLSHKETIHDFIIHGNEWLIVLEDDVSLINNLNKLTEKLESLHTDSIYILGGQDGLASFKKVLFIRQKNDTRKIIMGTHRWIYRTCCYMIHRNTALMIDQLMSKYTFMADDWGFILKNTKIKNIYFENFFSHPIDISNSTIESERILAR
ncbi:glycosyltransferase family 25 protein [Providencia sp. PAZ2]|uniref:glycosyltransferase family 25 protein n=1 Tax=Providencia lanzhouensis TaxID=3378099 RepID=UPI003D27D2BC